MITIRMMMMPVLVRLLPLLRIIPFIFFIIPSTSTSASSHCFLRHFPSGSVCLCNSSHCDSVPPLPQLRPDRAAQYTSSASGKRFSLSLIEITDQQNTDDSSPQDDDQEADADVDATLELDPHSRFQRILGFGGAFTDAVGIHLASLSAPTRKLLLKAYFGHGGIGYSLGRVPMASTDFSTRLYSYCDVEEDFGMAHFALAKEDLKLKIPYLRAANWLSGGKLKLIASPWSAPSWMKETGQMKGGGRMKGQFGGKYYASWANYFVKFFEAYRRHGVTFWGATVQNEPTSAGFFEWYRWQAMYFNAQMQRDFVRDLLGPALRNNSASAHLKLMVNDDNRLFLPSYPDQIFADPEASKYIDGVAVHWYWNRVFGAGRLSTTHARHPDKFILPTEACNGWEGFLGRKKGVLLGDWRRGEDYAKDIVENLENWAVGWMDWNLCLDENGGPSWARNWVDSPVIVNATRDEFYKQPMFYAIGHFSKFIRPGSVRIGNKLTVHDDLHFGNPELAATAAMDASNNLLVVVLLNRHETRDYRVEVVVNDAEERKRKLIVEMEHHSIATLVIPVEQQTI